MQIHVGASNFFSLFNDSNVGVPSFQRNYSWTRDQIEQFALDVFNTAKTGEAHFWGPIVVLRLEGSPKLLQVIDGQQRITTAIIFLSLLRDAAGELSDRIINAGTPGAFDVSQKVRPFLFQPPTYVESRFAGSYLVEAVLREYVITDPTVPGAPGEPVVTRKKITKGGAGMTPDQKKFSKELRKAYLQLKESLEKELNDQPESERKNLINRLFDAVTNLFEIHTMQLSNEDDAYVLFESLNDRGLRLNPSDLLKTYTLRAVKNSSSPMTVEMALESWDETVSALGDFDFTKFLRHYLLTQTDNAIQSRQIFKEFKKRVGSLGELGAQKNLIQIKAAANTYATLLGELQYETEEIRDAFARMNSYSDTHRVFLLGLVQAMGEDQETLRLLTRTIEFLSFRWIAAGQNAQELESIYQKKVRGLLQNPTEIYARDLSRELIALAPTEQKLDNLTNSDSPALQRYVLRRIEASGGGAIAGTPHIEHLAPKNPAANNPHWINAIAKKESLDPNELVYDDYVSNWGNLTLLEHKINISISNLPWPEKLAGNDRYKGINASNYGLNTYIKTLPAWRKVEILKREVWIKGCVSTLLSEEWVRTGLARIEVWNGE